MRRMRIFQLCGTASVNGFFGCGNFRTRGKIFILLRVTFIGQQKIRDILKGFYSESSPYFISDNPTEDSRQRYSGMTLI